MFVQKTTTTVKTSQVLSMSCQMYCLKNHLKIFKKNYKCLFVIYSMFQCSVSVLNVQCYMFKLNVCLFNFISSLIACRKLRSQRRKKKKIIFCMFCMKINFIAWWYFFTNSTFQNFVLHAETIKSIALLDGSGFVKTTPGKDKKTQHL